MTTDRRQSLGEVEAIALKAARGAGFTWGLAEEAAFAARFLAELGVAVLPVLAQHLDRVRIQGDAGHAAVITGRSWQSASPDPLCPIGAGAALSDHFSLDEGPLAGPLTLHDLAAPCLILPFLAGSADRNDCAVRVQWPDCDLILVARHLIPLDGARALTSHRAALVKVSTVPRLQADAATIAGIGMDTAALAALEVHVKRTYVPDSDRSRRGAGALTATDE